MEDNEGVSISSCIDATYLTRQLGFKLNKNEVEDGWWKKSYSQALQEVKNNYVASEEEDEAEDD